MFTRKSLSIAISLVLVGLGVWWWFSGPRERPRPPEIEQPLAEMKAMSNLPPDQRFAKFRAIREQVSQLSPEAQRAFRRASGELMRAQRESRLDTFFAAKTPAQRNQILDRDIREMEQRSATRTKTQRPNTATPRGSNAQRAASSGGGGGRRGGTLARLDRSTPQERARRGEYFRALNERRRQLGLPPMSRGRGGR
jgi:hypothetical protein